MGVTRAGITLAGDLSGGRAKQTTTKGLAVGVVTPTTDPGRTLVDRRGKGEAR